MIQFVSLYIVVPYLCILFFFGFGIFLAIVSVIWSNQCKRSTRKRCKNDSFCDDWKLKPLLTAHVLSAIQASMPAETCHCIHKTIRSDMSRQNVNEQLTDDAHMVLNDCHEKSWPKKTQICPKYLANFHEAFVQPKINHDYSCGLPKRFLYNFVLFFNAVARKNC